MKPYYQDASVKIYHADCREVLSAMKPGSVDLVLTDPPYGLGIAATPFRQRFDKQTWDDAPVEDALLRSAIAVGVHAIIWGGNFFGLPAHQRFLVWDKVQPESFSSAMCEQAWTNLPGPAKLFRRRVVSYGKEHPTQKPLDLMHWCLGLVPDAQTVLDPFMGSGTTLRAAKDLGRKAIGIEIEEGYCEIAAKRMEQSTLGLGL